MKNYSLVILLWIASATIAFAHGDIRYSNKPETIATLSSKKIIPDDNVRFDVISKISIIQISNSSPMKELRIYDNNGKLVDTCSDLRKNYNYNTELLSPGKYAFNIQIASNVVTHIFEKE